MSVGSEVVHTCVHTHTHTDGTPAVEMIASQCKQVDGAYSRSVCGNYSIRL